MHESYRKDKTQVQQQVLQSSLPPRFYLHLTMTTAYQHHLLDMTFKYASEARLVH